MKYPIAFGSCMGHDNYARKHEGEVGKDAGHKLFRDDGMISRFAAPILGILSFSVAVFAGIMAGLPLTTILTRAIWAMMIFCFLGGVIGWVAQLAVDDYFRSRRQELEATDRASSAAGESQATLSARTTP